MRAEIISIGTELLVGSILNTNSKFLSSELAKEAIDVYRHTTVGDNVARIVEVFASAASRSDLLVTSGGLGPTEDDVTLEAVGLFLKRKTVLHKATEAHIQSRLQKRGLPMTVMIRRQCLLPEQALVFKNLNGTAPGTLNPFFWGGQQKWLLVLPGPPRELEPMFPAMLRELKRRANIPEEIFIIRSVRVTGLIEVQVAEKVSDLLKLSPPVTVGIYAKPGEVELKIMAKADSKATALERARKIEIEIRRRLGKYVYGVNEETLPSVLGDLLRLQKKTLSVAESCTGGLLSGRLTDVAGSSDYFIGGIIAYHNDVKLRQLGVGEATLREYGAVSENTAREMAQNVRMKFRSSIGLSVTGIAGPSGATKSKPLGLVFMAVSDLKGTRVERHVILGSRADVRNGSVNYALNMLRLKLLK